MKLYLDEDNPMSRAALAKRFGVSYEVIWQGIKARLGKEDSRKKDRTDAEVDQGIGLPLVAGRNGSRRGRFGHRIR